MSPSSVVTLSHTNAGHARKRAKKASVFRVFFPFRHRQKSPYSLKHPVFAQGRTGSLFLRPCLSVNQVEDVHMGV